MIKISSFLEGKFFSRLQDNNFGAGGFLDQLLEFFWVRPYNWESIVVHRDSYPGLYQLDGICSLVDAHGEVLAYW
jgi:hypothetical protein